MSLQGELSPSTWFHISPHPKQQSWCCAALLSSHLNRASPVLVHIPPSIAVVGGEDVGALH